MKRLLTPTLVLVALAGIAAAFLRQPETGPAAAPDEPPATPQPRRHVVAVTYFTTGVRCPSCMKIEELTRRTVETRFAEALREGRVTFVVVNTDMPGNRHFIEDYQIVSKTVIVAEFNDGAQGRWVNLQDVWLKLNDEQMFEAYVSEAVAALL